MGELQEQVNHGCADCDQECAAYWNEKEYGQSFKTGIHVSALYEAWQEVAGIWQI